jgi:hypothetical protein
MVFRRSKLGAKALCVARRRAICADQQTIDELTLCDASAIARTRLSPAAATVAGRSSGRGPGRSSGRGRTTMPRRRREIWDSRAILWPCKDCGCEVSPVRRGIRHTWKVRDDLWKAAGMKPQGKTPLGKGEFLCFDCFKKRLGRPLSMQDYLGGYTTHREVTRKQWRQWLRQHRRAL